MSIRPSRPPVGPEVQKIEAGKSPSGMPTLLILGAGPKGLAIAAKWAVLKELGWTVPELLVVDRAGIASHWLGNAGFTDGKQILGTPPEKDVGFPYRSTCWGLGDKKVNEAMLAMFSWQAYLVEFGRYSDWIDRGRPGPNHSEIGKYLEWVAAKIGLEVKVGELREIELEDNRWTVTCGVTRGRPLAFRADGIVITGPGTAKSVAGQSDHPRITTGDTFWSRLDQTIQQLRPRSNVCVIGTGETAAAIVVRLTEALDSSTTIDVLTSQGFLFSRGESFAENRLYSNPGEEWRQLPESHRLQFVKRTDRGVFSTHAMNRLNQTSNVRTLAGRATKIEPRDDGVLLTVEFADLSQAMPYDHVVVAIGFDPMWFSSLLSGSALTALRQAVGLQAGEALTAELVGARINRNLAVDGLHPQLHLPMLAGVTQGPGFPNLSSLGLLSDRVLADYARRDTPPR